MGFSDTPKMPPMPKMPSVSPQARRGAGDSVQEAIKQRRALAMGGRRSTILGGGTSGATETTTLLGG